eukprot:UN11517
MCQHEKCNDYHPRDCTTPAIEDALLNSRPKSSYAVCSGGDAPLWVMKAIGHFAPSRILDVFLDNRVPEKASSETSKINFALCFVFRKK